MQVHGVQHGPGVWQRAYKGSGAQGKGVVCNHRELHGERVWRRYPTPQPRATGGQRC